MSVPIRDLLAVFSPEHVAQARLYFKSLEPSVAVDELRSLERDPDPQVRSYSMIFANELFPAYAAPIATELLTDTDSSVRWHACKVIHERRYAPAIQLVARIVGRDECDYVRNMAAIVLGEIGDLSVLAILEQSIQHEEGVDHEGQPIRETMLRAINQIQSRVSDSNMV